MQFEDAINAAAEMLGAEPLTIRAVLAQEASGRPLDAHGQPLARFEPHHFPRQHWQALGFDPAGQAPWRAALAIRRRRRTEMQAAALVIDREAALRAMSMGAPQIMGFNYSAAGYPSAAAMWEAFHAPGEQVMALARFVRSRALDGALRSRDWRAFAAYNGSGQPEKYAREIEAKYRRLGGQPSAQVLRHGATGTSVLAAQERLAAAGVDVVADGHFGAETLRAVREFQQARGLPVDGLIGARTWAELRRVETGGAVLTSPLPQPRSIGRLGDAAADHGEAAVAGAVMTAAITKGPEVLGDLPFTTLHPAVQAVAVVAALAAVAGAGWLAMRRGWI